MRVLIIAVLMGMSFFSYSQDWSKVKLDPVKEKKFTPYVELRHGGAEAFQKWKQENKYEYVKQMWYFSESFYIKPNVSKEGVSMDEAMIDVTRFEDQRKQNEETIITLPGFKDAIVLKAAKDCFYIYK